MLAQEISTQGGKASPWTRWLRAIRWDWRVILFCYVALAPTLALFAYVRVFPIAWSFVLSFYKWNLISPIKPFIGFTNYELLLSDENFLIALKNTAIYSIATVVISTALALPLASFLPARDASRRSTRPSTSFR